MINNFTTYSKSLLYLLAFTFLATDYAAAQVGINATNAEPDASAMLDISSTDKGILIPRMDSTNRKAISNPAIGLMVYDSTTHSFWFYNTTWEEITTDVAGDNLGNHTATENIQSNGHYLSNDGDNEGIYVDADGKVGIGTVPTAFFHVSQSEANLDVEAINDAQFDIGTGAQWQSFTATNSGTISAIELNFNNGASGQRTLTLYEGVGTDGNVLATTTATPSGSGWLSFSLSVNQVANAQYTIALDEADKWSYYDDVAYDNESSDGAFSRFEHRVYITLTRELKFSGEELTIGEYALPVDDGTDGQLLVTDGTGQITWSALSDYLQTDGRYLSNDGDNEGIFIDTAGNVGVGLEPENLFDILISDLTIDVENDNFNNYRTNNTGAWQAYTAVNSAQVQEVQFRFAGSIAGSQIRNITIYEGEGTGGTVLATGVMGSGGDWQGCYVNYEQVAGQKYTIQLDRRYNIRYSSSNTYDGGQSNLESGDYTFRVYTGVRDTISATSEGLVVGDYTLPLTDGEDGNMLVTDGNGTLSWSAADNTAFVSENGLTVSTNNNDDFVFGANALNYGGSGTELKFFFDRSKGAFRAGSVDGNDWDESNIGNYSVAMGLSAKASGIGSVAFNGGTATDGQAVAFTSATASAFRTTAFSAGTASEQYATAFSGGTASGEYATAFGLGAQANSYAEFAIGTYNTNYTADNTGGFDTDDRLFVIGNGTGSSNANRSDAMVVYKSGDAEINGQVHVTDSKNGSNEFVMIIENTRNDNTNDNDGLLIKAGHDTYNSSNRSSLIRFHSPNGTNLGRIRQNGSSDISFINSSDVRLKENIQPTQYGLQDILNIAVRDYNFKTDPDDYVATGFLAQQLHTIFPTAVTVGDDPKTNPWGVDYARLTPLLVKGMQDQQEIIEQQNQKIEQQQTEIEQLKAQVDKINALEAKLEALLKNP
ncbi:MAG: tail fiber domain-containing protein [Bacteroidota bacterium]